jgi:hypothetical protein
MFVVATGVAVTYISLNMSVLPGVSGIPDVTVSYNNNSLEFVRVSILILFSNMQTRPK